MSAENPQHDQHQGPSPTKSSNDSLAPVATTGLNTHITTTSASTEERNVTSFDDKERVGKTLPSHSPCAVTPVTDVTAIHGVREIPDGAEILGQIEEFLREYVIFPNEEALTAVTLWAVHTWVVLHFHTSPRLAVLSAEKGSGKTRLLECLGKVCCNPRQMVSLSPAALFRIIDKEHPTILIDEVDTLFSNKPGASKEDLRGILNVGYKKGAKVDRCDGPEFNVKSFDVFTPVVLAGIGDLPDTIMSRSVIVRIKRRSSEECVSQYRERIVDVQTTKLREDLKKWTSTLTDIGTYYPELPTGIEDRNAEVWEPLIAIADKADGEWPTKSRRAAKALIGLAQNDDSLSIGILLLGDIKKVFEEVSEEVSEEVHIDKLSTDDLLSRLNEKEESPWADFCGKPLDAKNLAGLLKPYGIKSKTIRLNETTAKGYERASFADAWKRYLTDL